MLAPRKRTGVAAGRDADAASRAKHLAVLILGGCLCFARISAALREC